jgi:hypothetical protein
MVNPTMENFVRARAYGIRTRPDMDSRDFRLLCFMMNDAASLGIK